MLIVIPTYRRTDWQRTLQALPGEYLKRTVLVCDEFDADIFSRTLNGDYGARVVIYPPQLPQTIAQKRRWIIEQSVSGVLEGHDSIVMMDDDLRFSVRPEPGSTRLRQADDDDLAEHLDALEIMLEDYAHAGWSMRQGNNNGPDGWWPNTRMCYVLGYRPEILIRHCTLGRIEAREDMDYTLQLLRQGFENMVCADIAVDQWSGFAAKGGCSADDRIECSNYDAFDLEALHPGLVTLKYKEYLASIPRVEVKCAWKKALGQDHPVRDLNEPEIVQDLVAGGAQ